MLREIAVALEPEPDEAPARAAPPGVASLPSPLPPLPPGLDMEKVEAALELYGMSMDDLGDLVTGYETEEEAAPAPPSASSNGALPDVPSEPVDFIVVGESLVMSDGSAIGQAVARTGRHEIFTLRKDNVPHEITDTWFRRTFGVKRCYLLNARKAVVGSMRLDGLTGQIVPERPLLPVARSLRGPIHPVSETVRAAARFLWGA